VNARGPVGIFGPGAGVNGGWASEQRSGGGTGRGAESGSALGGRAVRAAWPGPLEPSGRRGPVTSGRTAGRVAARPEWSGW